jgi:hypothetical protein
MRRLWLTAAIALAGCGSHRHPPPPRATPIAEHAHPPWSTPLPGAPAPRAARLPKQRGWEVWASDAVPGAAAAIEWDTHHRYRLRVAAGGRVVTLAAAEMTLDVPPLQDIAVSRDAGGRVLVAWAGDSSVRAQELGAGPARSVGRAYGVTSVVAGLGEGGRAVVAWGTHDGGEELNRANRVYAAVRDAGVAAFAPSTELDRAGTKTYATPRLELAVTRRASLLAWNVRNRWRHRPVRVARAGERGGFGDAVTLGEGTPGSVALRADGEALVSWTQDYRAYAALAAPGRLPGRAEIVSDADRAFALDASFGGDGHARLAWTTHRPPQARYSAVRTR